jgi:hypothetical protein
MVLEEKDEGRGMKAESKAGTFPEGDFGLLDSAFCIHPSALF